jgi:hypothetical protein
MYADAFNSKLYVGSPNQAPLLELALTTISSVKEGVQGDSVPVAGLTEDGQVSQVEHLDTLA